MVLKQIGKLKMGFISPEITLPIMKSQIFMFKRTYCSGNHNEEKTKNIQFFLVDIAFNRNIEFQCTRQLMDRSIERFMSI